MNDRAPSGPRRRGTQGRGPVLAWAFYDWGNSAFATSVMAGFFPLFLNQSLSAGAPGARTTARLMMANGIASLALALVAPILGAIADRGGARKAFLAAFAYCGAAATAGLFWTPVGGWIEGLSLFVLASIGFAGANVFYDALLVDVAGERRIDRVSAFGYALGYAGGGLLLAAHLPLVLRPEWFGLAGTEIAVRVVFLTVAAWWAAFTLPLLIAVREEKPVERKGIPDAIRRGLERFLATIRRVRKLRPVVVFLAAYWLYIDGVNTVMKVAIDFGYKLGIGRRDLMIALLVVQFISFPAALLFGWIGGRIGPRRGLLVGISVYVAVTSWAGFMSAVWEFYVLACAIGLVQGGVFSLSRSYFARLIPAGESAEFFGFYNMIGKFAAVLGPLLVAATAAATGSARSAVAAILPLFLAGGLLLFLGPHKERSAERT